tara:strand:+ start:2901 stop:3929 length:1029 start_codon:yes stop_codon:yes gene_type:complete
MAMTLLLHKDTHVIMHRRLNALEQLGHKLKSLTEDYSLLNKVQMKNPWFTADFVKEALFSWSNSLTKNNLNNWITKSGFTDGVVDVKRIGVICAGNIPLVGFHDIVCAYLSGNKVFFKPSSDDTVLCLRVVECLIEIDPAASIVSVAKLNGVEAIIATGNNNTMRYFEYYFQDIPRILRGARTSISIIDDSTKVSELNLLAKDIFQYFGRGCRSVTHLFLPTDFDIQKLFKSWFDWSHLGLHSKYGSNYDYQRALLMLNKAKFHENNFAILREDPNLKPPVGVINYTYYSDKPTLLKHLEDREDEIQAYVGKGFSTSFGQSQNPQLWDYADGVDTLTFCMRL